MNAQKNIERILNEDFEGFIKLVKNDVISVCEAEDVIIATHNAKIIYDFALVIENINKPKLATALAATQNIEYMFGYALRFKNEFNISRFKETLIKSQNAEYLYKFAILYFDESYEFEDAIIATNNAEYIYKFAFSIYGENKPELEEAIIKTKDVRWIYEYYLNISFANISKLEDAIIATRNAKYITKFANFMEQMLLRMKKRLSKPKMLNIFIDLLGMLKVEQILKI